MKRYGNVNLFVWLSFALLLVVILCCLERGIRSLFILPEVYHNKRIVWGTIQQPYLLALSTGLLLIGGSLYKIKKRIRCRLITTVFFGSCIVAGLICNITDWANSGGIYDYLVFGNMGFNLADTYIVSGLLIIIVSIFIGNDKNK